MSVVSTSRPRVSRTSAACSGEELHPLHLPAVLAREMKHDAVAAAEVEHAAGAAGDGDG